MPDPLKAALDIFNESLSSLMAHTIRASVNYFRLRGGLELDVRIIADTYDRITLGATSVLKSKLVDGRNLRADIFLHKHANRHLARICIAHELFHLLMELEQWKKNNKLLWAPVPPSRDVEDKCNQFAWELCRYHDQFNRHERNRETHIFFPDGLFDKPLITDISKSENWPLGVKIDPNDSFTKKPILEWMSPKNGG